MLLHLPPQDWKSTRQGPLAPNAQRTTQLWGRLFRTSTEMSGGGTDQVIPYLASGPGRERGSRASTIPTPSTKIRYSGSVLQRDGTVRTDIWRCKLSNPPRVAYPHYATCGHLCLRIPPRQDAGVGRLSTSKTIATPAKWKTKKKNENGMSQEHRSQF